jgi:hypothetical protein
VAIWLARAQGAAPILRFDLSLTLRLVALAVVFAAPVRTRETHAQFVIPNGAEVPSTRPRRSSACTRNTW